MPIRDLRQSTASQIIWLGPFVDTAGAAVTGLSIANTDIKLRKAGATAVSKNSGGATHDANGNYYATLDDTDTNTRGELKVTCVKTGALIEFGTYNVLPKEEFDSRYGALAQAGASSTITLISDASATDNIYVGRKIRIIGGTGAGQSRFITAYTGSSKVATVHRAWTTTPDSTSVYCIRDAAETDVKQVNGTDQTARDIGASVLLSSGTGTGQVKLASGYISPNWGDVGNPTTTVALSGTTVKAVTDRVTANTDQIEGVDATDALDTALAAYIGALNASASSGDPGTTTTLVQYLKQIVNTLEGTAGIPAFPSGDIPGNNVSLAECIRIIYTSLTTQSTTVSQINTNVNTLSTTVGAAGAGLTEAGGTGDHLTAVPWNASWDAEVQSEVADALVAYDAATGTDVSAVETKVDTIDDFLDTEIAAIKAKTDNLPSDPADASDVAASFATLNTKLDTIDDFLDTEIAAIKAKTDNLPSDPADASVIDADFDDVLTAISGISGGGGGGGTVIVSSTVSPGAVLSGSITIYTNENKPFSFTITGVTPSSPYFTLTPYNSTTPILTLTSGGGGVSTLLQVVTVTIPVDTITPEVHEALKQNKVRYSLRNSTTKRVIAFGDAFIVNPA